VQIERRGLAELQAASIYSGLTEPAVIPQVTACQSGEQSIWLRPGQAQRALAGAVDRYQGLQQWQMMAGSMRTSLLGDAAVPSLMVAGGALVSWAAQAVAEHEFSQLTSEEVAAQETAAASYLQASKAALTPAEVQAATQALSQARGRTVLPFGLSVPAALVIAFAAGVVLIGGAWYIFGRSERSPALTGSCPRRSRRALVMR
jgi:hypothetical protein